MIGCEQRDNLARPSAPGIILPSDCRCSSDAAQEGGWPHGSSDLEIAEIVGEVEKPVDKLDARNIFANIDAIGWRSLDKSHVHSLRFEYAERVGIGAKSTTLIKWATSSNHFDFRPTAVAA
jgi:hypothetical protein